MRNKFARNGARVFDTYELLEMLLYHVMPYKDTNPMAKSLISAFGNIDGVFSASREELMRVPGIGEGIADFILSVGAITNIDEVFSLHKKGIYDDYKRTAEMIREYFANEEDSDYTVAIFLFDSGMHLLSAKTLYKLDYASGAVVPKPFIDSAVSSRATVAITAHTHKHGPLFPTIGDMETNKLISTSFVDMGVTHAEHFIVSGQRYVGIMKHLNMAFCQSPALSRFFETRGGEDVD